MSLDVTLICPCCNSPVFEYNITHNLGEMAAAANVYYALWRPEEIPVRFAQELEPLLCNGLELLQRDPSYYMQFNSPNGWGKYEHLVAFLELYIAACRKFPNTEIEVSR